MNQSNPYRNNSNKMASSVSRAQTPHSINNDPHPNSLQLLLHDYDYDTDQFDEFHDDNVTTRNRDIKNPMSKRQQYKDSEYDDGEGPMGEENGATAAGWQRQMDAALQDGWRFTQQAVMVRP